MLTKIMKKYKAVRSRMGKEPRAPGPAYEYCPNCDANLTMQRDYRNSLPFWICRGCGEMLINPDVKTDRDIVWVCDQCGAMLNIQKGFHEQCGEWICTECGFPARITESELYGSEEEYLASKRDPYKGLSDEDVLALSFYQDIDHLDGRWDIILVKHRGTGRYFIKKLLKIYNRSIYEYLLRHPVANMPETEAIYEGSNCLIVIEEYVRGKTVAALLEEGLFPEAEAVRIVKSICGILSQLHSLPTPIVHRDIKPSNIIITPEGDVYLADMNVAKWYDPQETEDTRFLGTRCFAAPEQAGYGLTASSDRTDIYAVGILLNVMLTGKYPKEQKAAGSVWNIIERCISLEARDRFSARGLIEALDELEGKKVEEKTDT